MELWFVRRSVSTYSPPREEGWLRHQENFGEATLAPQTGWSLTPILDL